MKPVHVLNRRIVAFATHGLVPGDFPNLDQPALALASPDGKAETGLLTLEEILQMKLDADWVVLSACNTASGDGAGAEAISWPGRGFFYAGSRALLAVIEQNAVDASGKSIYSYAHRLFWAPYALVGDGGR